MARSGRPSVLPSLLLRKWTGPVLVLKRKSAALGEERVKRFILFFATFLYGRLVEYYWEAVRVRCMCGRGLLFLSRELLRAGNKELHCCSNTGVGYASLHVLYSRGHKADEQRECCFGKQWPRSQ